MTSQTQSITAEQAATPVIPTRQSHLPCWELAISQRYDSTTGMHLIMISSQDPDWRFPPSGPVLQVAQGPVPGWIAGLCHRARTTRSSSWCPKYILTCGDKHRGCEEHTFWSWTPV